MSKKRRLLLVLLVGGLVLLCGYVAWDYASTPEPGVTVENFHRLRIGMRFDQVVALLGPSEERLDKTPPDAECTVQEHLWYADGFAIEVVTEDGIVIRGRLADEQSGTDVAPIPPGEPSLLDTIRRFLHL